jgi:hypothetical protein
LAGEVLKTFWKHVLLTANRLLTPPGPLGAGAASEGCGEGLILAGGVKFEPHGTWPCHVARLRFGAKASARRASARVRERQDAGAVEDEEPGFRGTLKPGLLASTVSAA